MLKRKEVVPKSHHPYFYSTLLNKPKVLLKDYINRKV